jgi:hypothetical protein
VRADKVESLESNDYKANQIILIFTAFK